MAEVDRFIDRMEQLNAVGRALSREKNIERLLEQILLAAKQLSNADAGTLYRVEGDALSFGIIRTDSLGIALGGTTGKPITFPPVRLTQADGRPNTANVVAYAVLNDQTVNIPDAYLAEGFDFSGTKAFDESTGYRSTSFLTVPMKNHEDEVIGALQLLNAVDPGNGEVRPFSAEEQRLVESLASQAAVALTNRLLISQLENLFESFINLINTAIDDKSPYTGGHCERVPVLTMMLAEAASNTTEGPLADFKMSEKDTYELKIAGLLHDCGKVTTPVHVVDKATKLQTIYDRIELLDTRFELLKRDAELAYLRAQISAKSDAERHAAEQQWRARCDQIDDDREFIRGINQGGEWVSDEVLARIRQIGQQRWHSPSGDAPFLSEDELENLSIRRGTLTAAEREIINHHIVVTIKMLESLPWPRHMAKVPEYAGGHHERMDGKGYPRGLTREQMSIPARVMAIADVFEALTARDRPYKPGKTLTEALTILGRMKLEHHVDPDLFDVFVREKVWLRYAEAYLEPEQRDDVDLSAIPGVSLLS